MNWSEWFPPINWSEESKFQGQCRKWDLKLMVDPLFSLQILMFQLETNVSPNLDLKVLCIPEMFVIFSLQNAFPRTRPLWASTKQDSAGPTLIRQFLELKKRSPNVHCHQETSSFHLPEEDQSFLPFASTCQGAQACIETNQISLHLLLPQAKKLCKILNRTQVCSCAAEKEDSVGKCLESHMT